MNLWRPEIFKKWYFYFFILIQFLHHGWQIYGSLSLSYVSEMLIFNPSGLFGILVANIMISYLVSLMTISLKRKK